MDINSNDIELIVKKVISSMNATSTASASAPKSNAIPDKARVAMLTSLENFEIKEYPMPKLGDGDILVKVEGCGV